MKVVRACVTLWQFMNETKPCLFESVLVGVFVRECDFEGGRRERAQKCVKYWVSLLREEDPFDLIFPAVP